jgi:hypothetical protein
MARAEFWWSTGDVFGTVVAGGDHGAAAFKAMQDRQDAIRRSQMVVNGVWAFEGR